MLTHKTNGAVLGRTRRTMRDLEGPIESGWAFLGGSGWLGGQCACGYVVTARSLAGVHEALGDHQQPATCAAFAEHAAILEEERALE